MKKLFLFFFLVVSLNADYLALRDSNHCVIDLTPNQNSKGWCYLDLNTNQNKCDSFSSVDDYIDGYFLDQGNCVLKNDLKITGLTQNQFNFMMAVLAHVIGFTMLFLISFLSVLTMRK